ncbi:hypothetical protein D3C80_1355710 [compost metagenome]
MDVRPVVVHTAEHVDLVDDNDVLDQRRHDITVRIECHHFRKVQAVDQVCHHRSTESFTTIANTVLTCVWDVRDARLQLDARVFTTQCIHYHKQFHDFIVVRQVCDDSCFSYFRVAVARRPFTVETSSDFTRRKVDTFRVVGDVTNLILDHYVSSTSVDVT